MNIYKRVGAAIAAFALAAGPALGAPTECGDLNGTLGITATDSLLLLRKAVGQAVDISCPVGLHCWDLNANNTCDAPEDIDGDAFCDAVDCQGTSGPAGPTGATGPAGPAGPAGQDASAAGMAVLSARFGIDPTPLGSVVQGDEGTATFDLPFTFVINGLNYKRLGISMNGWLEFIPCGVLVCEAFAEPYADHVNEALPTNLVGRPFLAAYWDDLNGNVYVGTTGTAPNRVVNVSWYVQRFDEIADTALEIYVHLHEGSNLIDVWYEKVVGVAGSSATLGFQTAGGSTSTAHPISFNGPVLRTDDGEHYGQGWSIGPVR